MVCLGLIVLLAAGLRLHRLGDIQLWIDETDFYNEAVYGDPPVGLIAHALERRDHTTNTVGWPAAIWLSARMFGHGVAGARLTPVLLSIGMMVGVYFLALAALADAQVPGRYVAALAAAVFTLISMPQMEFSQRAFAYGGVGFFSAAIILCHMSVTRTFGEPLLPPRNSLAWVGYGAAMVAGLFIHPSLGLVIAASQSIVYGTLVVTYWRRPAVRSIVPVALALLSTLAAALSAVLNAKNPTYGRRGYLADYYHRLDGDAIPFVAGHFYDFLVYHLNPLWDPDFYWPLQPNPAALPLVAVCVAGWFWAGSNRFGPAGRRFAALAASMLAVQVACLFAGVFPFGGVRQSMFLAPAVFVFAGLGFGILWRSGPWKYAACAMAAIYLPWWAMTLPRFYSDRVQILAREEIVRLWEQAGKPPIYAAAAEARALRHALRGVQGISIRNVESMAEVQDPDFVLISLRWPVEKDVWNKRFSQEVAERGYGRKLLLERPAAHLNSWEFPTSLYFPPNGLWVYRIAKHPLAELP